MKPAPAAPSPDIRGTVLAAIASIAPECDPAALQSDRPLREQVDLDSLDWLNLLVELHKRLGVPIAADRRNRKATPEATPTSNAFVNVTTWTSSSTPPRGSGTPPWPSPP